MSERDPIPPGHGDPTPVGAVATAETPLRPGSLRPPVAPTGVCPICFYSHDPRRLCIR